MDVGIFYAYAQNASTSDNAAMGGFLSFHYEIEFDTYRPPTSLGFTLVNESEVLIEDNVATALQPSDNSSIYNMGARAARYIWDRVVPRLGTGTEVVNDRFLLYPPVGQTTPVASRLTFGNASESDLEVHRENLERYRRLCALARDGESKTPLIPVYERPTVVEDFTPWKVSQDSEGNWFYQMDPEDSLHPFPEEGVQVYEPQAIGDIQFYITYKNAATGVETVLYTISLAAALTATTQYVGGLISPAVEGYCRILTKCISTVGRNVSSFFNFIGSTVDTSGYPATSLFAEEKEIGTLRSQLALLTRRLNTLEETAIVSSFPPTPSMGSNVQGPTMSKIRNSSGNGKKQE
jgi:hypothetical protein